MTVFCETGTPCHSACSPMEDRLPSWCTANHKTRPQHPERQSGIRRNSANQSLTSILGTIIAALLIVITSQFVWPNTVSADDRESESPISLAIEDIEPSFTQGAARGSTHLRLTIRLSVRNTSSQNIQLERSQWTLLLNGLETKRSSISPGNELPEVVLQPGEEISGRLSFSETVNEQEETSLVLKWFRGTDLTLVALNNEIRRLYTFEPSLMGPDECLAVLSTKRNLDLLATWVLRDQLPILHGRGIRRLVIAADPTDQPQVTDEALAVLATAIEDPAAAAAGQFASPLPVQFLSLQLSGFSRPTVRRMTIGSGNSVPLHRELSEAIAAAVLPVYVHIDADRAFADLRSPQAGLQRAALEGCLDRMSPHQVAELLTLLRDGSRDFRLLLTSYLHRVPDPKVVPVLKQLSLSDDPVMSATALMALTQCTTADADFSVQQIWQTSSDEPELRRRLVDAALKSEDYRWCSLLAMRAEELLQQHAEVAPESRHTPAASRRSSPPAIASLADGIGPIPQSAQVPGVPLNLPNRTAELPPPPDPPEDPRDTAPDTDPPAASTPEHLTTGRNFVSSDADHLRRILDFLKLNNDETVVPALRTYLLAIREPVIQDVVADFLLQIRADRDVSLFRHLLAARLSAGTITDETRSLVTAFPSPDWTTPLLNDARLADVGSRRQQKSLYAALRCATTGQLGELVEQFSQLDGKSQEIVLSHLASVRYPGWHLIAQTAIDQQQGVAEDAVRILAQEGSDESIRVLIDRLQTMIEAPWDPEARDLLVRRQLIRGMISVLSSYALPDCRRVVNRSMRHPDSEIRNQALASVSAGIRRSAGGTLLSEVMKLKSEKRFPEALVKVEECLRADEFLPDAYLFRAALLLREDRLKDAQRDLQIADRLNPEEPSTLSTIALVMVRSGELETGLKLAEETLKLDPQESSNLYNAACVYARASEQPVRSPDQKSADTARAIELLQKSAAAGFEDTEHLRSDPDLVCLHDLPAWRAVEAATEDNARKSRTVEP